MVRIYKRRTPASSRSRAYRNARRKRTAARAARYALARRPRRYRLPRAVNPTKSKLVRLKYCELINLNPGVGTLAYHNFSCNGAYDPNVTGVGHQPLGFDQYMTFYDHYTVIGSKITIRGQADDTAYEMLVGIFVNDDVNFLPTTGQHACELPGSRYTLVSEKDNGENTSWTITARYSARKNDSSRAPLSNPELKGSAGGNPTEQTYYTIWVAPVGSADLAAVNIWVHIEYLIIFHEPKDLAQS